MDYPPPPPPLPMFEADSHNFALVPSVPRGLKLKIFWPAFDGDHRGTQGSPTRPAPLCCGRGPGWPGRPKKHSIAADSPATSRQHSVLVWLAPQEQQRQHSL